MSGNPLPESSSPSRPTNGSHLAAASAAAEELIGAIGLEPRHADAGRHFEPLQDFSGLRIYAPQIALIVFPGAVPELALDPGDAGDEARLVRSRSRRFFYVPRPPLGLGLALAGSARRGRGNRNPGFGMKLVFY
jgi:hypothetical protein